MDDHIKILLESIRSQIDTRPAEAKLSPRVKLTVKYKSQQQHDHKFRIVTNTDDKIKDVVRRVHDEICAIENTQSLNLRLFVSNGADSVQMLPEDKVHEAIDFGENEQEHLVIKIDQRKRAVAEMVDKAVQTSKITIKLPEVVQNSLPTRMNEILRGFLDKKLQEQEIMQIMAEEEDIKVEPLEPEVLEVRENKSASSLLKKNDGNVVMEALKDGTWYPARIIDPPNAGANAKVDAEKHVFVHFCGLSNADDQWLHIDRVRFLPSDRNTLDEFYKGIPSFVEQRNVSNCGAPPPPKLPKLSPAYVASELFEEISNPPSLFLDARPFDERRYKCSFCGKGFKRREHLINHERVHTGEKPFKCDQCDSAFGDPSNWRKHKKKHAVNSLDNVGLRHLLENSPVAALVDIGRSDEMQLNTTI